MQDKCVQYLQDATLFYRYSISPVGGSDHQFAEKHGTERDASGNASGELHYEAQIQIMRIAEKC
jgi:hypothetical protein